MDTTWTRGSLRWTTKAAGRRRKQTGAGTDRKSVGRRVVPDFKAVINRLVRALPGPTGGNKTYGEAELRRRGLSGPGHAAWRRA